MRALIPVTWITKNCNYISVNNNKNRRIYMNPEEMQETPEQAIAKYTTDFTKLAGQM